MGGAPAIFDDSRSAWNAAPSTWTSSQMAANTVPVSQRIGISWHYPGGGLNITPASSHASCYTQVKNWQYQHQHNNGWADIGYNLLICQHARVIEGRGVDLKGAHSPGVNWEHYGVQFMVSGTNAPTAEMYARAVTLRAALEAHSGHALREWGHKDDPAASTDCPGTVIETWVHSGGPYAASTAIIEEDPLSAFTEADLRRFIREEALNQTWGAKTSAVLLSETHDAARTAASGVVSADALAAAVVAALPAAKPLTVDDVKSALAAALADSVKVTGTLTAEPVTPPAQA